MAFENSIHQMSLPRGKVTTTRNPPPLATAGKQPSGSSGGARLHIDAGTRAPGLVRCDP